MPVRSQYIGEEGSRKRKAHKKSRQGCRNCKLRSVKCDETKPKCKNCTSFGVVCNYDPKTPDLEMFFGGLANVTSQQKPPCTINQALLRKIEVPVSLYPVLISADDNSSFQFDKQSVDRFGRFMMRTVLSIGSPIPASLWQNETIRLACSHPFLMHIVQTLTAIHDRYLTESPNSRMAVTEVYHWSRAAALFNQKLSAPIQPHDRDALWAAAALLGFISFASVEASKPEDAWPLKRLEKPGLEWLRMSEGKMAVWNLAEPWRPESIFHNLLVEKEHRHRLSAATRSSVEVMPAVFNELYGIDDSSTPDNNPYYSAVHSLARLLRIECNLPNVPTFLGFMKHFDLKGMRLLEQKDPRMLLLLAYWYAKVCHSAWWIERRATIECQGICLYLERYHADQTLIQELLEFPRLQCGLGSKYGTTFESICIP